jgi:hypothetical protein
MKRRWTVEYVMLGDFIQASLEQGGNVLWDRLVRQREFNLIMGGIDFTTDFA